MRVSGGTPASKIGSSQVGKAREQRLENEEAEHIWGHTQKGFTQPRCTRNTEAEGRTCTETERRAAGIPRRQLRS